MSTSLKELRAKKKAEKQQKEKERAEKNKKLLKQKKYQEASKKVNKIFELSKNLTKEQYDEMLKKQEEELFKLMLSPEVLSVEEQEEEINALHSYLELLTENPIDMVNSRMLQHYLYVYLVFAVIYKKYAPDIEEVVNESMAALQSYAEMGRKGNNDDRRKVLKPIEEFIDMAAINISRIPLKVIQMANEYTHALEVSYYGLYFFEAESRYKTALKRLSDGETFREIAKSMSIKESELRTGMLFLINSMREIMKFSERYSSSEEGKELNSVKVVRTNIWKSFIKDEFALLEQYVQYALMQIVKPTEIKYGINLMNFKLYSDRLIKADTNLRIYL